MVHEGTGEERLPYPIEGNLDVVPVSVELSAPGPTGYPYDYASLDVRTGRLAPGWSPIDLVRGQSVQAVVSARDAAGLPTELTGLDAAGGTAWKKQLSPDSTVVAVRTTAGVPGTDAHRTAAADLYAVVSRSEMTVFDAVSGEARWTASTSRCGLTPIPPGNAPLVDVVLDAAHDDLIVVNDFSSTCTFAASTGAPHPLPDVPSGSLLFGPADTYVSSNLPRGDLAAYDRKSGRELWRSDATDDGQWLFAGGYLVRLSSGDRLTGLG